MAPRFLENLCIPALIITRGYKKEIYVTSTKSNLLIKYKNLNWFVWKTA
jgi:hypothetical protein